MGAPEGQGVHKVRWAAGPWALWRALPAPRTPAAYLSCRRAAQAVLLAERPPQPAGASAGLMPFFPPSGTEALQQPGLTPTRKASLCSHVLG
jgi:hypothetical protein